MHTINDFIGVFPDAISKENCQLLIEYFENMNSASRTINRQMNGYSTIDKETEVYYFTKDIYDKVEAVVDDPVVLDSTFKLCNYFTVPLWNCYNLYAERYGILSTCSRHKVIDVKLQKTRPKQGYHVWHCENGTPLTSRRLLLVIGYLNDVEEGGETEFLYQGVRIKPKQGTIIICPGAFTHTHRGNPPLSGDKYIINTWIQYIDAE